MNLDEFKKIFWYEWVHRMWGRVIGLAFIIPGMYFASKGYMTKSIRNRSLFIGTLIGLQVCCKISIQYNIDINMYIYYIFFLKKPKFRVIIMILKVFSHLSFSLFFSFLTKSNQNEFLTKGCVGMVYGKIWFG